MRKAQIAALSGKSAVLREATDAHRAALAEAVRETKRLGGIGAPHTESLTRTLESLSLAAEPPPSPGRLTEVLQPAGFEALAGVTLHVQPRVRAALAPPVSDAEAKKQEAEKKHREAEIKKAEAVVERATRELADAKARLDKLR